MACCSFSNTPTFFINNINAVIGTSIPLLRLTLPLGISFYTFQTMSYSIDVYRGDVKAEHNLINFGAYVVMFPQLIAGPIVKYSDVAERLHILKGRVTMDRIDEGISLFIFGLAKKVLLADGISALWYDVIGHDVNGVWEAGVGLSNASTPLVWLGIISYALQIYFDFSGYSMMGIGMGKMLGFDFPDNFNLPYISRSITEFWRRWHITLSSWFKEYVYIPLGGNRKGLTRQLFNIFVVWFLTGFWHGANWNFIFWGLYYCVLLMIEKNLAAAAPEKRARSGRTFTRCCLSLWAGRCSSAATKAFRSGCCFKSCSCPRAAFHRCTSCATTALCSLSAFCALRLFRRSCMKNSKRTR